MSVRMLGCVRVYDDSVRVRVECVTVCPFLSPPKANLRKSKRKMTRNARKSPPSGGELSHPPKGGTPAQISLFFLSFLSLSFLCVSCLC